MARVDEVDQVQPATGAWADTTPATTPRTAARGRASRAAPLVGALLAGSAVVVVAVGVLRGDDVALPGLPDAGAVTDFALPLARLAHDVLAAGTVGALLLEGVLLPRRGSAVLGGAGRVARWAVAWAVATGAWALLSLSDALAVPVWRVLGRGDLLPLLLSSPFTLAQVSTVWFAGLVAVVAHSRPGLVLTRALLPVALLGLVPTAVVGHPGTHGDPVLGAASLSLHLTAASVWVGGLLALLVHLHGRPELLAVAAPRFSRVALVCVLLLGASGVVGAATVLEDPARLLSSGYGLLLVTKAVVLGLLVLLGCLHRSRTLAAAIAGRPGALLRLALGELVLMGAVVGLAVTLSSVGP